MVLTKNSSNNTESTINNRSSFLKISLIIPALDKEENLPRIIHRIPPIVSEILIVDGHSKDDKVKIAKEICPQAKVFYQKEKGKGDAIR